MLLLLNSTVVLLVGKILLLIQIGFQVFNVMFFVFLVSWRLVVIGLRTASLVVVCGKESIFFPFHSFFVVKFLSSVSHLQL